MSQVVAPEQTRATNEFQRCGTKCRIPQRLPLFKPSRPQHRIKNSNAEPLAQKPKDEIPQSNRSAKNAGYPRSGDSRPKSGPRSKDDATPGRQACAPTTKSTRAVRSDKLHPQSRPRVQRCREQVLSSQISALPDQEEINMREKMEMETASIEDSQSQQMLTEADSITSRTDTIALLKVAWQDNVAQFEKMKSDLHAREGVLLELYASMTNTHKKMSDLGHLTKLPPLKDPRMINVTKHSPENLLKLCAGWDHADQDDTNTGALEKSEESVDITKLYKIPTKLVATCEETLIKRKEIIDWFESIKQEDKKIGMHALDKKIKEFNAENEVLHYSLQKVKHELRTDLDDIVDCIRKSLREKIALQLRAEQFTCQLSEINAKNDDLKKQIHIAESSRSQNNRHKVEELEKQLKEEKCKKVVISNRLSRAEGQVKIGVERASQLEATLEQARSKSWTLERTVQLLRDQNQNLQADFDKELNKLTESIRQNTDHLEEIAEAREKLQTEKEDLEKRLQQLSDNYNESIKNVKDELNTNIAKHVEKEEKYKEVLEQKKEADEKIESLCAQLIEAELRYKDVLNELNENKTQLNKAMNAEKELEMTNYELDVANKAVESYRNQLTTQSDTIREIEINFKETIALEKKLKYELKNKDEYISELKKKEKLLEAQLKDSECKMESYEQQLEAIKQQINQLQKEFGDFQNLNELHDMVVQQRAKLIEATRQNNELGEALQKKNAELENHLEQLAEQENILEQRDSVIKMLSEKEEEQANIIKLLRNNLELRAHADTDISQQLSEKNAEINALVANVETRKQQMSQLEKIILTLEDQLHNINLQKRKDHEKIRQLEKTVSEYESYHLESKQSREGTSDNLDNLIKLLENELGTPFAPQLKNRKIKDEEYSTIVAKKYNEERKLDKPQKSGESPDRYQLEHEKVPTKIVMGNFVKKTYITNEELQYKRDNLDRKKAITNIDTQKWVPAAEPGLSVYKQAIINSNMQHDHFRGSSPLSHVKDQYMARNLQLIMPNQAKDEKKSKMFKLAGHRI